MLWIGLILVLFGIDQITKNMIVKSFNYTREMPVINDFFYITFWQNKGAAWGILQGEKMILLTVTVLALFFLIYMFQKCNDKYSKIGIALIIGGALGNFYDRLLRTGGVVDFLLFKFGSYHFPAFNFADSCIVCGTILMIFATFLEASKEKAKQRGDETT